MDPEIEIAHRPFWDRPVATSCDAVNFKLITSGALSKTNKIKFGCSGRKEGVGPQIVAIKFELERQVAATTTRTELRTTTIHQASNHHPRLKPERHAILIVHSIVVNQTLAKDAARQCKTFGSWLGP